MKKLKERFMEWLFRIALGRVQKSDVPQVEASKPKETSDTDMLAAIKKALADMMPDAEIVGVEVRPEKPVWEGEHGEAQPLKPEPAASTRQILGGAAAPCDNSPSGMSPEQFARLMKISERLQVDLRALWKSFDFDKGDKLSHEDKLYVLFDAATAFCAEFACSEETVRTSTLGVPDTMMTLVELVQHNFYQKQKRMYDQIGNWVH